MPPEFRFGAHYEKTLDEKEEENTPSLGRHFSESLTSIYTHKVLLYHIDPAICLNCTVTYFLYEPVRAPTEARKAGHWLSDTDSIVLCC